MTKKILLIGGSLNQTTMMHQIASHLGEYECYFTPFYADGVIGLLSKLHLLDFSILGGNHRKATIKYLEENNLRVDVGGKLHKYDAVIMGTDLLVQNNIRGNKLILVQEGMTEREDFMFALVKCLNFPRFLANTAATGLSDAYDVFCVASAGYRDLFVQKGARKDKMIVTGVPNFDHAEQYLRNTFPYQDFVLVATSSIRETGKFDFRIQFLEEVQQIAGDREVIFKLHPNENHKRAVKEIRKKFPDAKIYIDGNLNEMIANCEVFITQFTSAVYIGLALGKKVHSYFDINELQALLPVQNGGKSAGRIASVVKATVKTPLPELRQGANRQRWITQHTPSDL
jgi:hypothetical protein